MKKKTGKLQSKIMKLIHIINGLGDGGAEAMLFKILLLSNKNDVKVISLMNRGKYGERLESLGFEVICLNMKTTYRFNRK